MAYQKLQVGRATDMDDKQSDTEDTVNLNNVINTYTRNSPETGPVVNDSGARFITDGVKPGDLAFKPGTVSEASRVIAVNSETQITLTTSVISAGSAFTILSQSEEPAVLYVGTAASGATLKVRSSGGDDATFVNIQQGSFIPVQVKRVYDTGTTASNIVALF
tara:strand:+ start:234 stop:722 length:489 start_codon:yes stop_codon:yes gene_type:complete